MVVVSKHVQCKCMEIIVHTSTKLQYYMKYCRIPQLHPPLSYMLALGKAGEGAYLRDRDINFTCDDNYRPMNATWACDPCTFSGSLIGKTQEKRQK